MADPNITTLYNWLVNDIKLSTREVDAIKVQWEKGDNALDSEWTQTINEIEPPATTGTELLAQDWKWYEDSQQGLDKRSLRYDIVNT